MTSKEALKVLYEFAKEECETNSPELLRIIEARYNFILKDLETLENIKSKTLLLYSDRKKIAKEYEKWCEDNNALVSDPTNMVTWMLKSKLEGWLDNDK